MDQKYQNKAFTLIELLVVIAVIGLLATIVSVSVNNARTKARDAKRKADLKNIQLALNLYYDQYGHYPIVTDTWQYSTETQPWLHCHNCSSSGETATSMNQFFSQMPTDPKNNSAGPWGTGNYTYAYSSDGTKYDLVAQLENTSDSDRCGMKRWLFHYWGGEGIWCTGGYGYSDQLYADH